MSAELFRRASDDADGKLIRKWIVDLENVIEDRDARIRDLEEEVLRLKTTIQTLQGTPQDSYYTPVNAPMEFTETPGTYIPISKPSEAEQRIRKALLSIDAATIKDWEETEQALRKAAVGIFEDGKEHLILSSDTENETLRSQLNSANERIQKLESIFPGLVLFPIRTSKGSLPCNTETLRSQLNSANERIQKLEAMLPVLPE